MGLNSANRKGKMKIHDLIYRPHVTPTQIITEYRQSQTTVYSDEFGGIRIEETHIEIQSTNEFGGDFPLA